MEKPIVNSPHIVSLYSRHNVRSICSLHLQYNLATLPFSRRILIASQAIDFTATEDISENFFCATINHFYKYWITKHQHLLHSTCKHHNWVLTLLSPRLTLGTPSSQSFVLQPRIPVFPHFQADDWYLYLHLIKYLRHSKPSWKSVFFKQTENLPKTCRLKFTLAQKGAAPVYTAWVSLFKIIWIIYSLHHHHWCGWVMDNLELPV